MDSARAKMAMVRPWIWSTLACLCLTLSIWGAQVQAQGLDRSAPAVLVADDIRVTQDRRLIATGNVEAFQGTTRLTAAAISYDPNTERLTITGPISIDDGDGVRILADQGELDRDLQNGLLTGARIVLNEQLQLAAVQVDVVDGRYTQLYKTAVTSCRICANDPRPPLWQIRARRVIHDKDEKQLYFDDAQFLVRNIPIIYIPRLRLPDPTQDRATGFLIPQIVSDSRLGVGFKLPYFIKLGDHKDLTLTPFITTESRTLEFRYRQAFTRGRILFEGAISEDDLEPGERRGFLFGAGQFELDRGFRLDFDLELVTDDSYLSDFNFSSKDRLDSQIQISRTQRDEFIRLGFINYRSLRDDEDDDISPSNVVEALYERRFFPKGIGGEIRLAAIAHGHRRESSAETDANGDGIVDGRDVLRVSLESNWLRTYQMGGVQAQTQLGFAADAFDIGDDATSPNNDASVTPMAALTLRYPLAKQGRAGVRHVIEPIVQVAYVGGRNLNVPNEESTRPEFDEGNLLSLSRFPAPDRRDRGFSTAFGGTWARFDPEGFSLSMTAAQIIRVEDDGNFSNSTGLTGTSSDFLLAGQMRFIGGLAVSGRTLFDQMFDVTKAEFRGDWSNNRVDVGTSFIWIDEDTEIDQDQIGEVTVDGSYRLNRYWTLSGDMRYDIEDGRFATAEAGLAYQNECVRIGFSVDRTFANSTTIEPSTSLGVTVSLQGFSADTGESVVARSCGK